jgi:hypothetical protein
MKSVTASAASCGSRIQGYLKRERSRRLMIFNNYLQLQRRRRLLANEKRKDKGLPSKEIITFIDAVQSVRF